MHEHGFQTALCRGHGGLVRAVLGEQWGQKPDHGNEHVGAETISADYSFKKFGCEGVRDRLALQGKELCCVWVEDRRD